MDQQKSWLWKKRTTEKTLAADKANNSLISNQEEETQDIGSDKQVKIAQEAIAGWEKAEAEAISLKKDLQRVLQQKAASEERLSHLDAALKECMQQLHFVQEEQEKRVHSAVMKASQETTWIALDEKLAEAGKRIAKLDAENMRLNKAVSGKDKVIEELSKYRARAEADLSALMLRVESTQKENASLKYEVRVLEKELDIRNEEREFTRRTADVAQKQQMESVKKIAKLESECQRLRVLVQKRLPGPADLRKMRNEAEILGKDQFETRRRRSNPSLIGSMDFRADVGGDAQSRRINLLTEQLHVMEEENRSLKHALNKKSSTYAQTPSRLSRGDGQVEESLKGQPGKYPFLLQEHSSDLGSDDKASFSESWASALVSELEHFKNEKLLDTPSHGYMGTPDMNLMDDFAEMEKLVEVSVDYPAASSHHSSDEGNAVIEPSISGPEIKSDKIEAISVPGQLDSLLKMLLEHCQILQRNPHDVLEDMKVALLQNSPGMKHNDASYSPDVNGHGFQTLPGKPLDLEASDTGNGNDVATTKKSNQCNVGISIHKILDLLEGIHIISQDNDDDKNLPCTNSVTPTGYTVRVFQWKTAELSAVLQQFARTCNDLLSGTADLEQFAQQVAASMDWVMNHCFSLQDVSSMKEAIRSRLDWDESRSESEVENGLAANHSEISFQDTKGITDNLESEMETLRQPKGITEDEIEKQKMMKEDHESQLMGNILEQRQACQKISRRENDLENTNHHTSNRQEETCNDLKSKTSKEVLDDGKQLRNDWEITAASEKLAACQQTILNLGKQLKALTSPRDAALFDKVISEPGEPVVTSMSNQTSASRRLSLRDNMLAEDNDQITGSPGTKADIQNGNTDSAVSTNATIESCRKYTDRNPAGSMAIVPIKKSGGRGFLKKLFWRHRKGNSKKTIFSKAATEVI